MKFALFVACLLLASCASCPPPLTRLVAKPVPVPADLPPELLDPIKECEQHAPVELSVDEAKRVANARGESIDECNKRIRAHNQRLKEAREKAGQP